MQEIIVRKDGFPGFDIAGILGRKMVPGPCIVGLSQVLW